MVRIFISYRRSESAQICTRLYQALIQHFGPGIYKDVENTPAGVKFLDHLKNVIADSDIILILIGQQWLGFTEKDGALRLNNPEDAVRIEIQTALRLKKKVIPVLVDRALAPEASLLPEPLRALSTLPTQSLRGDDGFAADFLQLASWIEHEYIQLHAILGIPRRTAILIGISGVALLAGAGGVWLDMVLAPHDTPEFDALPTNTPPAAHVQWQATIDAVAMVSLAADGTMLFAGGQSGTLYAFDTGSGTQLWKKSLGARISVAVLADTQSIYVALDDATFIALDRKGTLLWTAKLPGKPLTSPILAGSSLALATDAAMLVAFTIGGTKLWEIPIASGVNTNLAVDKDQLYLTTSTGKLSAFRLQDGTAAWSHDEPSLFSSPALDPTATAVYVGTNDGAVLAFASATGTLQWRQALAQSKIWPVVSMGMLFGVAGDGNCFALQPQTGKVLWHQNTQHALVSAPQIAGSTLLLLSEQDVILAIATADGTPLWRYQSPASIASSPVGSDKRGYLCTTNNSIIAFTAT